jgi:Spy/CpxP family protein refolding chaperone
MRDRFLAVLLTLAVFAGGFAAGIWGERHRPFPAPPAAFMGEYGARRGPGPHGQHGPPGPPVNREQLMKEIDAIRPQMDLFKSKLNDIYTQFDHDIETVLTPEQWATYQKVFTMQRITGRVPPPNPGDKPLSDEQIEKLMQRPLSTLAHFVVLPMTLDRMTTELKLDDTQRDKVKDLLRVRREKFLELVDGAPPLSLVLSRLAPIAERLGQTAKPTPTPAQ